MLRSLSLFALGAAVASAGGGALAEGAPEAAPYDVAALLAAARGAPPLLCSLAAQSVRGGNWGDWSDAPATPLDEVMPRGDRERGRESNRTSSQLAAADVERALGALAADDACVREIGVRLLGRQEATRTAGPLIERLAAPDAALRSVAALGLGQVRPAAAIDPLIRALRDVAAPVRANAAWALGRIGSGRALAPLLPLFRDASPVVREAAVVATGHMDSASTVAALIRTLQTDDAPRVRRVAAWALGTLESRSSAEALAAALARDADAGVREMSAWALGNMDARASAAALRTALARDADDAVRETAAWVLGHTNDREGLDALGAAAGGDRSARVRGTAAWAIGHQRGNGGRAPAGLLRALRDESDDTRLKAAWAAGQIGDAALVGPVRDALKAEQSAQVRRALVRALIKSGGRSEETLTELLASGDPQTREAAVRGLAGNNAFNPWPWPWPRPRPFP